jgi:hypothetical protein
MVPVTFDISVKHLYAKLVLKGADNDKEQYYRMLRKKLIMHRVLIVNITLQYKTVTDNYNCSFQGLRFSLNRLRSILTFLLCHLYRM